MVTHDPVAAAYTDRVVFLADGRIVDELRDPTARPCWSAMTPWPRHDRSGPGGLTPCSRPPCKSLLGRKLRLLMSTFAIVLGVAFVAGSLVFTDTLGRSFTALFASTRRRRRRPARRRRRPEGGGLDRAPCRPRWSTSSPASPARPASTATSARSASTSSARTTRSSAASAPPAFGGNWTDAPAGHGLRGPRDRRGREPRGPDEVAARREHRRPGRLRGRRHGPAGHPDGARRAEPTLVGIAGFPDGGSLNGATLASSTPRPRRTCSSTARTPSPTSG